MLLVAAPLILVALALMVVGAVFAEIVANPGGLTLQVPEWVNIEFIVWIVALIVVGSVLIRVQRRYGTVWALLALGVLVGVALLALTIEEAVALLRGYGW